MSDTHCTKARAEKTRRNYRFNSYIQLLKRTMLNPSIWFHFTYCRLGAKHDFYSEGGGVGEGDSNFTGSRRRSQYF